jgi:hypothetical protein
MRLFNSANGLILILISILFSIFFVSCRKDFTDNPEDVFRAFWQIMDENYVYFEEKRIDWDSVYNVCMPRVKQVRHNDDLLAILEEIISKLRDNNLWLMATDGYYAYYINFFENTRADTLLAYNDAYMVMENNFGFYYKRFYQAQLPFVFWQDTIKKYTFIEVSQSFTDDDFSVKPDKLLYFFDSLSYQNGIIIDIRNNDYSENEKLLDVAAFFFDNQIVAYYEKHKIGFNRNDFSERTPKIIYGQNKISNEIPIIVLTTPRTTFTANYFANIMKQLPNCRIVGEQSEGLGRGVKTNMAYLPNKWELFYPNIISKKYDAEGNCLDVVGVKPDIFVKMRNFYKYENMKDSMVLRAVEVLDSINGF